jgi:hypothetical protein
MKYDKFSYIFPPRPDNPISPDDLDSWDNGSMIGQIKTNGSNCVIFTNFDEIHVMGRHRQRLSNFQLDRDEILSNLYKFESGKWLVINAEYLNKSKFDENNKLFNHKLIIFDILVCDSDHLIGKTFSERISILDDLYGKNDSEKDFLYSISENIYRAKSYESGFKNLFDKFTPIDLVEGVILKRKNAKLEMGLTELNNHRSQVKARKMTKNYKY